MSVVRSSLGARRGTRLAAVLVVCGGLLLAACGSSSGSDSSGSATTTAATGSSTKDDALAKLVPAKLTKTGKIVVGTDSPYAPNEFVGADNKTLMGMDIDLGTAIGEVLGIKFQFVDADFAGIIPGLGSRYDLGMSSFTDNKEREQQVDMVTYFTAGESFMVETGKNADLTTLDAICGKNIGVEAGTVELDDATAQSKKCTAAGQAKVNVLSFPDQAGVNLALSSGRADASFADSPVNAYAAKQSSGKFEVIGKSFGDAPYGIVVSKKPEYKGLSDAILGAVKKLDADGTYTKILAKWGIEGGAITDFKINGATS